jgi:hypothetical protein
MELVRDRVGSEQITGAGGRRMLGQEIRTNISLLHIVHRSELSVVFIIARVAVPVSGKELGEH